jgi:hypothetical protein
MNPIYFVHCRLLLDIGWGNLRERYNFEEPGVDGRILLRWIFRNWNVEAWIGSG